MELLRRCSEQALQISIHALREEGDHNPKPHFASPSQFLSTPSARRATGGITTPCGTGLISIHALREEGDSGWRPSVPTPG